MRPKLKFLTSDLLDKIFAEAIDVLESIGVEINNPALVSLFEDHGARIDSDKKRVYISEALVNKALQTVPNSFSLFDTLGQQTHDFNDYNIHFTPGSAALNILDHQTQNIRKPLTEDYVKYAKLMSSMDNIASQSTAFIPTDVVDNISDSYRLFLSLMFCDKPIVTGAFTIKAFEIMKDLQLAVRGSEKELKEKPLTIFSCCPTSPLKWSDVTSQNLVDCARYSIPVEFISMPLTGFVAPVTLTGTVTQHTIETLSGVVISQLVNPGAPVLWGASPAAFDMRYETTPMGAIETMMIDCACNEVGKFLKIPTQAYISLSDAKLLDAQAGLETGIGATLASLAGINNISGPGMLDFENCHSLEKLVLDNEIAGMCLRLVDGITPREDFPLLPLMEELLQEDHLLISSHTRKFLRQEHFFPGPSIDRANRERWNEEGSLTLGERAHSEVDRLLDEYKPSSLADSIKNDLKDRMQAEAAKNGQENLPAWD